jgi:hypothetical protein
MIKEFDRNVEIELAQQVKEGSGAASNINKSYRESNQDEESDIQDQDCRLVCQKIKSTQPA